MDKNPIIVKLDVATTAGNLVASLTFQNVSNSTIYLDKASACLTDEQTIRLFEISDKDGNVLKYTGISIKRKFDKNDFVGIEPGQHIKATVALNKWYEFHDGGHEYSILYKAFNHSFDTQVLFRMESNRQTVTYIK